MSPWHPLFLTLGVAAAVSNARAQEPPRQARRNAGVLSVARIVNGATPATVTIVTFDAAGDTLGQGSGFILRSDGIIVTCWHVMEGASRATVVLANREQFERVTFLDGDSVADIAVLRVPGFDLPVILTRSSVPAVGEHVVAIGSPLGLSRTATDGIVSAVRVLDGRQLVQISAAISPGSSGGPVLDATGRAFAIARMFLEGGQQLNFAVPVRYALGLLQTPPREKPLDSVFASGSGGPSPSSAVAPAPARVTRTSLVGTYSVVQTWTPQGGRASLFQGLLISADESTGLLVLLVDTVKVRTATYGIVTFRTNSAGQVVLEAGGIDFDGYQTDDGVYLTGDYTDAKTGAKYAITMHATPTTIALSYSSGLYRTRVRTQWASTEGVISSTFTDWGGNVAVVVANDSVWVDLSLSNADGGTIALFGSSALGSNSSFDIWSVNHNRHLQGSVSGGVLSAQWTDYRDVGRFYGPLQATRQ
jgi:S1-C subfamily serine protease